MAGSRDTEMAVGCWQPNYHADNPHGEVHMFRQSLWTCLLKLYDPVFKYPGTIECVYRIKELIHHNWLQYIGPDGSETPGMLLPYPINILPDGDVENLRGAEEFPDFKMGSRVIGKKSGVIPEKLST